MRTFEIKTMTREEYILFNLIEVTESGDNERHFIRGIERTPEEAFLAAQHYDAWKMASDACEDAV